MIRFLLNKWTLLLPSHPEHKGRSTWASTSMHSTPLWLRPRERPSTVVWPTGRESTSQRKSTTQVRFAAPLRATCCFLLCVWPVNVPPAGLLSVMDVVEVNPLLGANRKAVQATASLAVDIVASALGQTREGAHSSIDDVPAVKGDTEQLCLWTRRARLRTLGGTYQIIPLTGSDSFLRDGVLQPHKHALWIHEITARLWGRERR